MLFIRFIKDVREQYTGAREILRSYWVNYGGLLATVASPYLHLALFLLFPTSSIWLTQNWWDIPLSILPNLISFTLAGYAMLMAFGDDGFKAFLKDRGEEKGPLLAMSATFAHFIVLQTLSLLLAIVAKSRPCASLLVAAPRLQSIWIFHSPARELIGYAFWGFSFLIFLYSVTSIFAVTMSVFRVSRWFNMYSPPSDPDTKRSDSG